MKHIVAITTAVVIVAALLVASGAIYIVDETRQVVITQFGEPIGDAIVDPGIKFKVPLIQKANYFEKRFLEWDGYANQIPTKDKKFIWVDTYARWRISEPLLFFQRVRDELGAQTRLDDILDGETRDAIARHTLVEIVRNSNREFHPTDDLEEGEEAEIFQKIEVGREMITNEILKAASQRTADLGIELLDIRLKRINYVEEVRKKVYERMISERKRIAERYRSEGQGEAARIRGQKEKELKRITSEAYRKSQEIIGEADAEATQIYAEAYNRSPEFYKFIKTLETYRAGIDEKTLLLLTTDGEFFQYIKEAGSTK